MHTDNHQGGCLPEDRQSSVVGHLNNLAREGRGSNGNDANFPGGCVPITSTAPRMGSTLVKVASNCALLLLRGNMGHTVGSNQFSVETNVDAIRYNGHYIWGWSATVTCPLPA